MSIFYILVFPGFLFLGLYSLILEYLDRKLYAKMQNRVGPHWFQPIADLIKLLSKETIIPVDADKRMFTLLPIFAFASVATSFLYMPIWSSNSLFPFEGDLIVILYLLTVPTLIFFLAGWFSTSVYATIGAVRAMTQLFAYEVPLFIALLSPAILADTWSLSGIAGFYNQHPLYLLINIPAFLVALIAVQGKLERVPFDMPEAETEIVAGSFTEYSGRFLAIFRMTVDSELVVVSTLLAALFLPFFSTNPYLGFVLYIVKTLAILFVLTLLKSVMARIRIEQMVDFCWKILTPIALVQLVLNLVLKGVLPL